MEDKHNRRHFSVQPRMQCLSSSNVAQCERFLETSPNQDRDWNTQRPSASTTLANSALKSELHCYNHC
jgi:hypothetical protein